jgi:transcriptional regulator with XRE-family HTH domain
MELGKVIKAARVAKGLTQDDLGRAFGVTKSAVAQWESGKNVPDGRKLHRLAELLGLDPGAILAASRPAGGDQSTLFPAPAQIVRPVPAPPITGLADVPVWASVAAGNGDGMMILTDTPIDYIKRSDHIANAVDPFAFYIVGDSMEERFYQGDQVVVNRSLPLRPGDDCVFISQGEDGQLRGLVKRLLRSTAEAWKVRQLNPRKDFDLPKRPWSKAYRIVEIRPRG